MYKNIEDFIFPSPFFNYESSNIKEYTNNLIFIPTERKNENNEIEKIPCIFLNDVNSSNILIIFHCNGADIFDLVDFISDISEKENINILLPEYPGYSIYNKPKSSKICLENSLIIYDFVLNNIKNITKKNIFVLGRSLGTGPAIY